MWVVVLGGSPMRVQQFERMLSLPANDSVTSVVRPALDGGGLINWDSVQRDRASPLAIIGRRRKEQFAKRGVPCPHWSYCSDGACR